MHPWNERGAPRLLDRVWLTTLALLAACDGAGGPPPTGDVDDPVPLHDRELVETEADEERDSTFYAIEIVNPGRHLLRFEADGVAFLDVIAALGEFQAPIDDCNDEGDVVLCEFEAGPGRFYVRVTGLLRTPWHTIEYFEAQPEGSADAPIALTIDDEPRTTIVQPAAPSFFAFDVATSGAYELVFDEPGADAWFTTVVTVHANGDLGAPPVRTCTIYYGGAGSNRCYLSGLASGHYGLVMKVGPVDDEFHVGALSIVRGLGEGALTDPLPLALGTFRAGTVDEWSSSYYAFTTGGTAGAYVVDVADLPSSPWIELYPSTGSAVSIADCSYVPCTFDGLSANTTYIVELSGTSDLPYRVRASPTAAIGSVASPIPLALGATFDAEVDATSYYAFTTTTSGPYAFTTTAPLPLAVRPSIAVYATPDFSDPTVSLCYAAFPCRTVALDAGTTYYLQVRGGVGAIEPVPLALDVGPYGEGSRTDPVPVALDASRIVGIYGSDENVYAFATDALGSDVGVAVRSNETVRPSLVQTTSPVPSCTYVEPYGACIFQGLAPNTTYTLILDNWSSVNTTLTLRMLDLAIASGCDVHAASCYDFESGSPAGFTEPAASDAAWATTTGQKANGATSYVSGNLRDSEIGCFETTVSASSWIAWFSYREETDGSDRLRVYVDGVAEPLTTTFHANSVWRRAIVTTTPASGHVYRFCYEKDATTSTGADAIWIDDLQFE